MDALLEYLPDISKWNLFNGKAYLNSNLFIKVFLYAIKNEPGINEFNKESLHFLQSFLKISYEPNDFVDKNLISNAMTDILSQYKNIFEFEEMKEELLQCKFTMGAVFSGCISLKELPDISKWNTSNYN